MMVGAKEEQIEDGRAEGLQDLGKKTREGPPL